MKTLYAVAIVIGVSAASGFLAWRIFHKPTPVEAFLTREAARIGVDRSWWVKVTAICERAGHDGCGEVSASDYEDLYKAIATGVPAAQKLAMMAIGHCPPSDRARCFAVLNGAALKARVPAVQEWAFGDIWEIYPDKRDEIRREGLGSKFSEVREEVPGWPDGIPHEWNWRHSR